MPPLLRARGGRNIAIRPMCYVWERDIIRFVLRARFLVICCACPACGNTCRRRKQTRTLLQNLEGTHPGIKTSAVHWI